MMPAVPQRFTASWIPLDWAVAGYTLAVLILIIVCADAVPEWPLLVSLHGLVLIFLLWLPRRGAAWEESQPSDPPLRIAARRIGRFLRYTFPALLLTPFFEEVRFTANALRPDSPYWFEPYLYAADRVLFETAPVVWITPLRSRFLDELMHAFYLSFYPLVVGGIVLAWIGPSRGRSAEGARPGPGFPVAMTSIMLGFFFAYAWYPFLPARGPWENRELMSAMPEFRGLLFTPLVQWIIDRAAVSGGCFPSAHVAGSWGLIVGLVAHHRKAAVWLALIATGLSAACVYTGYHHVVDVLAGLMVGLLGGIVGRALARRDFARQAPQRHEESLPSRHFKEGSLCR